MKHDDQGDSRPGCDTYVVKFCFSIDAFVQSALIEFYSSSLDMGAARKIFDGFWKRDVVLWTTMIDGYAKSGDMETARYLFEEMPDRNVITWEIGDCGIKRCRQFWGGTLLEHMQEPGMRPNASYCCWLANTLSIPTHSDSSTACFVPDEHLLSSDYIKRERERKRYIEWGIHLECKDSSCYLKERLSP
ncbi:hypothetical protein MRB53_033724 [Persea americana]|uniref:Uncharacterized protein n=1 Tax=Persea americana TaxID=3435 RepID=A0ACC2KVD0_PERAE|nr:hypothetical protein MRB53_033724 [Persea americana]